MHYGKSLLSVFQEIFASINNRFDTDLLSGNRLFNTNENTRILNPTINFIFSTKRFDEKHF